MQWHWGPVGISASCKLPQSSLSPACCSLGCEVRIRRRSPRASPSAWLTALISMRIGSIQRSGTKPGMWLFALLQPNRPSLCRGPQQPQTVRKVLPENKMHKPGPRLSGCPPHRCSWLSSAMAGLTDGPLALPRDPLLLFRLFTASTCAGLTVLTFP